MLLNQANDHDLVNAFEENLYDFFREMCRVLPGGELEETEHFSRHYTSPAHPMFKGVWKTPLEVTDEMIEEQIEWFKARQADYVAWWVMPYTPDLPLIARLKAHGFVENFVGTPSMAGDLHDLPEHVETPTGFEIVKVTDQKTLEDWRDVFYTAFGMPPIAAQAWVDATLSIGISNSPWQMEVGYLDGKPVASNQMLYGGGVAGLFAIGSLPEVRGKGIGKAITVKPLLEAREKGYRHGVLFASKLGYPIYQKLGFHDLNHDIARYLWINPALQAPS